MGGVQGISRIRMWGTAQQPRNVTEVWESIEGGL